MASLAVFDFDSTIVDKDSDSVVIEKLREKQPPPEYHAGNRDWTPYMSQVFEHAYSAGLRESDVLDAIASMRPTPGAVNMLRTLHEAGWHILLLTDANSVFVHHWLSTHQLEDCVTAVITNRAFWDQGRLFIEPCMRQTACARCPTNLCKSIALAQWCARRQYPRVCYTGDGRNDYCPATNLPKHAIINLSLHATNPDQSLQVHRACQYPRVCYTGDGRNDYCPATNLPKHAIINLSLHATNPDQSLQVRRACAVVRASITRVTVADYCPATNLPKHAVVFPRRGYPLDDLIKKTMASPAPHIQAKVVPWDSCDTILQELTQA